MTRPTDADLLALLRRVANVLVMFDHDGTLLSSDVQAAITALSSPAREPGERERELEAALRRAEKALNRAEDGAGSVKAKDAVPLRPADWHAVGDAIRALSRTEAKSDAE